MKLKCDTNYVDLWQEHYEIILVTCTGSVVGCYPVLYQGCCPCSHNCTCSLVGLYYISMSSHTWYRITAITSAYHTVRWSNSCLHHCCIKWGVFTKIATDSYSKFTGNNVREALYYSYITVLGFQEICSYNSRMASTASLLSHYLHCDDTWFAHSKLLWWWHQMILHCVQTSAIYSSKYITNLKD